MSINVNRLFHIFRTFFSQRRGAIFQAPTLYYLGFTYQETYWTTLLGSFRSGGIWIRPTSWSPWWSCQWP